MKIEGCTINSNRVNNVTFFTVNPNVEPEESLSNEINISYRAKDLFLSTSGYINLLSNLIFTDEANPVLGQVWLDAAGTAARNLKHQAENGGNARAIGVDAFGRYSFWRMSLWGSYSFVDFHEEADDGSTSGLAGISAHNFRLGFTLAILDNLWITPSLILRSTPDNIPNTYGMDDELEWPYELNAHILYEPSKYLGLFVTLRNMSNHAYALHGQVSPTPQRAFHMFGGVRLAYF